MTDAPPVAVQMKPAPGVYPAELERAWLPAGGPTVQIRALRPEDIDLEANFVAALSPQTLYLRLQYSAQPTRRDLERLLELDYVDRLAIAGLVGDGAASAIVGVARYARIGQTTRAECAIVVADGWHGRGLGTELMRSLTQAARARGLNCLEGTTLAENPRIATWARRFGFNVRTEPNSGGMVKVTLDLDSLD